MIDAAKCLEIREWADRRRMMFMDPPQLVVDRTRTPGDVLMDEEAREVRMHPEDANVLYRWVHSQLAWNSAQEPRMTWKAS